MCTSVSSRVTSVTYHLWTPLEDACTELDFRMAEVNHGEDVVGSNSFIQHSITLQQWSSLKSQLECQMAHVTLKATFLPLNSADSEGSESLHVLGSKVSIACSRAEQMVSTSIHYSVYSIPLHSSELSTLETTLSKKFTLSDGPFYKSPEQSLKQLKVKQQAYQGSTFVGNPSISQVKNVCERLLVAGMLYQSCIYLIQPKSTETLGNNITKLSTFRLQQHCHQIHFSYCHNGYNSSIHQSTWAMKISSSLVRMTSTHTWNVNDEALIIFWTEQHFNAFHRASFPEATVLPKMHIL